MSEKKRILVVDDEEDLCEIVQYNLEQAGFEVETALSAEEALTMNIASFDLILLDIMMGEMSGFKMADLLKKNKNTASIPIIFCTAKDTEEDTLTGLEIGADDYVSKPFSVKEMVARVKAVLRRSATPSVSDPSSLQYDRLMLDTNNKKVTVNGAEVELTKTEFEILHCFMQHPNKVFSREDFLSMIWNNDVCVNDRTVDVHITRLRKKIFPYGKKIVSRSGYGYFFETN